MNPLLAVLARMGSGMTAAARFNGTHTYID